MTVFIGNNPEQVPLNGTLGNMAFQNKERVNVTGGTLTNVTINSPTIPSVTGTVVTNGTLVDTVEAVGTSTYNVASQYDVGTGANQIPLNQYLGTMAYQDSAAVNVQQISVTTQINGGYNNTTAVANTAAQALGTNTVSMVLISADTTLTTTVPRSGAFATVLIKTSGTNSRTVTFGTGFKSQGTLATGVTADRFWAVNFVSDGTFLYEISRTTTAYA